MYNPEARRVPNASRPNTGIVAAVQPDGERTHGTRGTYSSGDVFLYCGKSEDLLDPGMGAGFSPNMAAIGQREQSFIKEGGLRERMTRARLEARQTGRRVL